MKVYVVTQLYPLIPPILKIHAVYKHKTHADQLKEQLQIQFPNVLEFNVVECPYYPRW